VAVNTPRRLRLLVFAHAASVAAIAAVTLWRGHIYDGRLNGLLGGNYGDPNDLALAFVISLPMCFALLFLTKSLIWKAAWTAAILVMTYAIFRTGSRGGFLALIVTGSVFLWEFAIRGRRPYLLVFAALVGVIIPISSSRTVVRRFQETFNPNSETSSAHASSEERKELFWRSVDVTKEHPIFGVGPDNFIQLSGNWHVAHNSYTQLSAEGGIPALILYVLILCCGFKNIRKAKRLAGRSKESAVFAKALHASLIGYMAGSFFLSVSYGFFPYFLVAYTTALFLIAKKSGAPLRRLEAPRQAISAESSLGSGQVVELSLNPS
jgi:putative inorganic carbon (hco3(-)) transporter